jgi:hypothetical protein
LPPVRRLFNLQLSAGVVVEEKQGLGAEHRDVVGAHRHQVDADAVEAIEFERQFQLGADAIGTRNQ